MNELKNSPYNDIKAGVYASRAQLCIHPDVKTETHTNILNKCRALTKKGECTYKNNVHAILQSEPDLQRPILDIEDLLKAGQEFKCCPYYTALELRKKAQIVFLPYNYLFDPKIRDRSKIDLMDSIVIIDEAHNVEKVCEDNACTTITTADINEANSELNKVMIF